MGGVAPLPGWVSGPLYMVLGPVPAHSCQAGRSSGRPGRFIEMSAIMSYEADSGRHVSVGTH
ncbi:TPA: hypothetical protein DCG86_09170 [Candidatus Marinimicrobia bacterium]|nr:hypothetical protein [Candidatus Neomarinimicrobiota bacterium]